MANENRYFKNNIFISKMLQEITIRPPKAFIYVGQTAYILDEKAEVDRHHFLDAVADGDVSRLIFLHFESLLPANNSKIKNRPPQPPHHAGRIIALRWNRYGWARTAEIKARSAAVFKIEHG